MSEPSPFKRDLSREGRKGTYLRYYTGSLEPLRYSCCWHLTVRKLGPVEKYIWTESSDDYAIAEAVYRAEHRKKEADCWANLLGAPWTHVVFFGFTIRSTGQTHALIDRPLRFSFEGLNADSLAGGAADILAAYLKDQTDRVFLLRRDQYIKLYWLQFVQSYVKQMIEY